MAAARLLAIGLILTGGIAASRPGVMPGTLTLSVAGESTEFEVTYCRTEPYKALGTTIEAEATSVGSFRGQPAALFVRKVSAEPAYIQLWLTELSAERQAMSPYDVTESFGEEYGEANMGGTAAIMEDYSPEKMKDLSPEERIAKTQEMMARLDELNEELDALVVSYAKTDGTITVDGSSISFDGDNLRQVNGEPNEAFADLSGAVRVTGECVP